MATTTNPAVIDKESRDVIGVFMRFALLTAIVCSGMAFGSSAAPGPYQHGTVVRMHMGECTVMRHSFISQFGPPQMPAMEESCPEYTLLTDKVVYVIVGKSSNQLVPLAEVIDFRFENKELAVRVDDARKESKFTIKEMTLRTEWEQIQRHVERQLSEPPRDAVDTSLALRHRQ
jgi:hypothetical protein